MNKSGSAVSDSLQLHGLWPARLLCPRDSPDKNTGMGCHYFLQRIFLTQELNLQAGSLLTELGGKPISWNLIKFMSTELVMVSNHLILCHPLLLLPSTFPSIRVLSSESVLHLRWPKYWSLSISPSREYSGLISFRIDWFDLLAVQGTLESSPTP